MRDVTPSNRSSSVQVRPFLLEVCVIVDEPRHHRLAAQVDTARGRTGEPVDVLVGADGDDAIAADGHRLRDRELIVDGNDFSVRQDDVGRLALWRSGLLSLQGNRRADDARDERCEKDGSHCLLLIYRVAGVPVVSKNTLPPTIVMTGLICSI